MPISLPVERFDPGMRADPLRKCGRSARSRRQAWTNWLLGVATLAAASAAGAAGTTSAAGAVESATAARTDTRSAWQCEVRSPARRVALVELYTSEGCSSCPPADRWLSALTESALGPDRVVALAWHVAYWDYIGWKDPFADPRHEVRQREQANRNRLRTIYTPQVVTDGRDTPAWHRARDFLNTVADINADDAGIAFTLSAEVMPAETGEARRSTLRLQSGATGADTSLAASVHLVVFEDGLQSAVTRGENAGRSLAHDRVVRLSVPPGPWTSGLALEQAVTLPADLKPENAGVAAFVQSSDGRVLQASACHFKRTETGAASTPLSSTAPAAQTATPAS